MKNLIRLQIFIRRTILIIGGIAAGYLLMLSLFGTLVVQVYYEDDQLVIDKYLLPDFPVVYLLLGACVFLFVLFLYRRFRWQLTNLMCFMEKRRGILYFLYFLLGIAYIYSVRLEPGSDPAKLMGIAKDILNGNVETFTSQEGYMFRYPYQNTMVLIDAALILLFHDSAFLVFQTINLIAEIVFIEYFGRISDLLWGDKYPMIGTETRIATVLFFPFFLYVTYNYGTVLSLSLIIFAVYEEMRYLQDRKWGQIFKSGFAAAMAVVVKSNSLIFLMAMVICLLMDSLTLGAKKEKPDKLLYLLRNIIFAVLLFAMFFMLKTSVNKMTEIVSGVATPDGMPKLCWIAMGLQGDGSYNGTSVNIFREAGFEPSAAKQAALQNILYTLRGYAEHPGSLLNWFGKKMAYQWNDPMFGGLFQTSYHYSNTEAGAKWMAFCSGRGGFAVSLLWNVLQSVILAGTVVYVFLSLKTQERDTTEILMLGFLGGFLFHIVWEGGCQYVLPYFMMLIPCSLTGWKRLFSFCAEKWQRGSDPAERKKWRLGFLLFALVFIIVSVGSCTVIGQKTYALTDDESRIRVFVEKII